MERARPPRPQGKPLNWWAHDQEPWLRVSAEIKADDEKRAARFHNRAAALLAVVRREAVSVTAGAETAKVIDWEYARQRKPSAGRTNPRRP
jgi:hypothetical protein